MIAAARAVAVIGTRAAADLAGRRASPRDVARTARIDAGLDWLCRAQDHGVDRGFSYGYTVRGGWQPSYVETTGYIICTFLWAAETLARPGLRTRAVEAGHWLLSVQLADGSFPNPALSADSGVVFDTGQDLHGLLSLASAGGGDEFADAANRAARWLVAVADDEGRWTRNTFNGIPHVYNTRTAWALARAGLTFGDSEALAVARANLDWACSQQLPNGWFDQCAFTLGAPPFTHTTAYAGRGLHQAGVLLSDERYLQAARQVAEAAAKHDRPDGGLPGRIGLDGRAASRSTCLTGNAQFAILWLRLADADKRPDLAERAERAITAVAARQALAGPLGQRGAIKGSHPIWGRYAPLGYPNWATKFFVDALLLSEVGTMPGDVA